MMRARWVLATIAVLVLGAVAWLVWWEAASVEAPPDATPRGQASGAVGTGPPARPGEPPKDPNLALEDQAEEPLRASEEVVADSAAKATGSGARVAGVVTIDGRAPNEPLQLALLEEEDATALRVLRSMIFFDARFTTMSTDEHGRFAFTGLSEDWAGALVLPMGYGRAGDGELHVMLGEPTEGLVIDLQPSTGIVGRVVSEESREPVAGAFIFVMVEGRELDSMVGVADEDGSFALGQTLGAFESMTVIAVNPEATLFRRLGLDSADVSIDPAGRADLGEILLRPSRSSELLVVDQRGEPIQGARASAGGDSIAMADPTGPDGTTTLVVAEDRGDALAVEAKGYWRTLAGLPEAGEERLRVVLSPVNRLEVVLETESGEVPPPGLQVVVTTDAPLSAAWDQRSSSWVAYDVGLLISMVQGGEAQAGGGDGVLFTRPDSDGRASFRGLWPGRPLQIDVKDSGGRVLVTEELAALGRSETRSHRLVIAVPDGVIEGAVLGPDGRPVEGATVWLREGASPVDLDYGFHATARSDTDAAGSFKIEGLGETQAALWVQAEGFAPLMVEGVHVGARPGEYRLKHGRRVTIHVVDEGGAPVTGVHISHDLGRLFQGGWGFAREHEDGTYVLSDLPDTTMHLRIGLDGADVELDHDTNVPTVEVVVPITGGLQVDWQLPPEVTAVDDEGLGEFFDFVLVPAIEGGEEIRLFLFTHGQNSGEESFYYVPTGDYEVYVVRDDPDQSGVDEGRIRKEVILGPVGVTIESRKVVRIRIGP